MSQQRYTPEFKDEAVRQVTEKGHSVQEVAACLGVSSHSLSKWVKAASPNGSDRSPALHQNCDAIPERCNCDALSAECS